MLSAKQGSIKYHFLKSLVWPSQELNQWAPAHQASAPPLDHRVLSMGWGSLNTPVCVPLISRVFVYFLTHSCIIKSISPLQLYQTHSPTLLLGRGNSIMVSISVCRAGRPGSSPVWSTCFRKVGFYQNVINLSPPVPMTGSPKATHLSCLC